jgi:hypothetical protein
MKLPDIERLHTDGFLSAEQRDRIVTHYQLQEGQNKFVIILSVFGGLLVAAGIILLIASIGKDSRGRSFWPASLSGRARGGGGCARHPPSRTAEPA